MQLQAQQRPMRLIIPFPQSETSDEESSTSAESSDDDDEDDERDGDDALNEEQEEFDRELARMMAESGREARSAMPARRNILNERSLPTIKRQPASHQVEEEDTQNMKFTLLMKKGAKQQVSGRLYFKKLVCSGSDRPCNDRLDRWKCLESRLSRCTR